MQRNLKTFCLVFRLNVSQIRAKRASPTMWDVLFTNIAALQLLPKLIENIKETNIYLFFFKLQFFLKIPSIIKEYERITSIIDFQSSVVSRQMNVCKHISE